MHAIQVFPSITEVPAFCHLLSNLFLKTIYMYMHCVFFIFGLGLSNKAESGIHLPDALESRMQQGSMQ